MARSPQRAGNILRQWLATTGLDAELRPYVIAERWPQLVGPRIAARTRPGALREGTLTVEVATSAWLNELSFLRAELLEAINRGLADQRGKGAVVARLRLVVGPPAAQSAEPRAEPRGSRPVPRPPEPEPGPPLEDPLPEGIDPLLAEAIRRARRSGQGPAR